MIRQTDLMDPARANALFATLGRDERCATGDHLPPFFHHIYFWNAQPGASLGRDGHPKVGGGLVPDLGLPRRMWAGGTLRFEAPLRAGVPATRESRCAKVEEKTGRTGALGFVTLAHEIRQDGRLCIAEEQELVYRPEAAQTREATKNRLETEQAEDARACHFDSTMLFRYSALTFNGHRIHYDADYARDVEGYGGLVVHGPLLAQLLMMFAAEQTGPLTGFTFRGIAPLILGEAATLCRLGRRFWVETKTRQLIMTAQI